jgi:hypothetical protein
MNERKLTLACQGRTAKTGGLNTKEFKDEIIRLLPERENEIRKLPRKELGGFCARHEKLNSIIESEKAKIKSERSTKRASSPRKPASPRKSGSSRKPASPRKTASPRKSASPRQRPPSPRKPVITGKPKTPVSNTINKEAEKYDITPTIVPIVPSASLDGKRRTRPSSFGGIGGRPSSPQRLAKLTKPASKPEDIQCSNDICTLSKTSSTVRKTVSPRRSPSRQGQGTHGKPSSPRTHNRPSSPRSHSSPRTLNGHKSSSPRSYSSSNGHKSNSPRSHNSSNGHKSSSPRAHRPSNSQSSRKGEKRYDPYRVSERRSSPTGFSLFG